MDNLISDNNNKNPVIQNYIMDAATTTTASGNDPAFSWKVGFIIIFLLAFLGVNIFVYLAKGTDMLKNITQPIFGSLLGIFGQTVNVAGEGAKTVVKGTAATALTAVDGTQYIAKGLQNNEPLLGSNISLQYPDITVNNALNQAINTRRSVETNHGSYSENDGGDVVGKWCYVGEYNSKRSCRAVVDGDTCMSGNIFPSRDVCINPNLRV